MTLGKIERFWKTIQNEYLQRAQFGSFEEAVERTAFWIKYYNYKRPHQGIGGLCPADRFFEIQHALKKTLEQGVAENTLELALRGKPRDPFYMVGRMGDQSVVIRAEKGQVKMLVDDEAQPSEKELVYDARKDIDDEIVSFRELLISDEIYMEALVQLLIEKGILTKEELLGRIKQVQMGMVQGKG